MEMNYCHRCGTTLRQVTKSTYECEQSHTLFLNPSPTVGIFLIDQSNNVLLAVRGKEPQIGALDTFGGFVDGEETLEQAITRELREELGLEPSEYDEPTYLISGVGHYQFGGETNIVLGSMFWAKLRTDRQLIPADDAAGIRVAPIHEVNFDELRDEDIRIGVKKLQEIFS